MGEGKESLFVAEEKMHSSSTGGVRSKFIFFLVLVNSALVFFFRSLRIGLLCLDAHPVRCLGQPQAWAL